MREALCIALARHSGKVLDQDTARAIVRELLDAQRPLDLTPFTPQRHGGYVIAAERFAKALPELHQLHLAHWQETEAHRHGLGLNPNYPAIVDLEAAGRLLQVTLRTEAGQLAGHLRMYLATSLHTQTTYAEEDTIYIEPAHRHTGSLAGLAMTRYAEDCLRRLGVREVRFTTKHVNKADAILRRLRYQPVATQWVKVFKENDDVQ